MYNIFVPVIARWAYEEVRNINLDYQRSVDDLRYFIWPCWEKLTIARKAEEVGRIMSEMRACRRSVTSEQITAMHDQIIAYRIGAGWRLGDRKDNARRTDPYLKPMEDCPGWFYDLCYDRDECYRRIVSEVINDRG